MRIPGILVALASLILAVSCSPQEGSSGDEVVAYSSVDQVYAQPVFEAFEKQSGIKVRAVYDTEETKSTGVLNRLIAEGQNPQADLFWSGDPIRPMELARGRQLNAYVPRDAATIPANFRSAEGLWTGSAARARVLLVNRERLGNAPLPSSVKDLADPRWKGQVAIANPLYGTTTMQAAVWFTLWGDDAAKRFFDAMKANGVRVAGSNGEVRRLVVAGEVTFGLTDTDDAFEAVKSGAPVEIVYPDQQGEGTLVMPTSVVLIKGGPNPGPARKLADFLISPASEAMMAVSAAHMPLHARVNTPDGVKTADQMKTVNVDYGAVSATMTRIQPWLRSWVGL